MEPDQQLLWDLIAAIQSVAALLGQLTDRDGDIRRMVAVSGGELVNKLMNKLQVS